MPNPSALAKLTRAARLSAEAARLGAEACSELSRSQVTAPVLAVTEVDRARARRALRKAGLRT